MTIPPEERETVWVSPAERAMLAHYAIPDRGHLRRRIMGILSGFILVGILFVVCELLERMKDSAAIAWASEIPTYDKKENLGMRLTCAPKVDAAKKKIPYELGEHISYQLTIINRGKKPILFRDIGPGGSRLRTFLRQGRGGIHQLDIALRSNDKTPAALVTIPPKKSIARDFMIDLPSTAGSWSFYCTLSNLGEREPEVWARAIKTASLSLRVGSPKKITAKKK